MTQWRRIGSLLTSPPSLFQECYKMNNKFEYDKNNKPIEKKIISARRLSNGRYYVNGRIVPLAELSQEEREQVKAIQAMHDTTFDREGRTEALRQYKELKQ